MATSTKARQELSNNNYFIVILLITLLVLGVTGVGAKMLIGSIVRDGKVLTAKNKASTQLEKNLVAAPKLVENFKALGTMNALIADSLPTEPDFPGLIAMMENLSAESGITLKSIAPSSGAAVATTVPVAGGAAPVAASTRGVAPTPQTSSFNAAFDGTFASFQRLIANLEASARPVKVTSLQLSGSGGSLAVQFEGTTYYQDKATVPFRMEAVK
ncbi:MAG: hypothetical protein JWN01_1011 [Patescibacteria group bacterium]|nr:hypothetical protein [Patescibacteria group bacterium]